VRVSNPECSPVGIHGCDAAPTPAGFAKIVSDAQLRDLAASAARVFGWDSDKPGFQLNQQFVISQEQLEQIRALRDS
jgi:hypothetical protein